MFVKSTHYNVAIPSSITRLKARPIKLPYKKIQNSKERVLLIFDNAHRSDSSKNTLASGLIGDFIKMVDARCKNKTGNSIFSQSIFTINYSYAYEDSGSESADTESDDGSGDIEKVIDGVNTQRLLKFIKAIKPTKIVTLGRKGFLFLRQFYTDTYLHKVAWASMLGVPKPVKINDHDCNLIAMLNPNAICQYTTSREPYLIGYFCRAWENVVAGKLRFDANVRPETVKVVFIDTIEKFDKLLALLYSQKEVAIDTETTSLYRVANTMLTIQFAFDKKKAFFLPYKHYDTPFIATELNYIKEKLADYFLNNENTVHLFCNANFDIPVIRKELEIPIYPTPVWDIQAGEYALDENVVELVNVTGGGYYNLGNLSLQYGFDGYMSGKFGKEDRVGIGKIPLDTPGLLNYGGYDVVVLHGIKEQQLLRAKAEKHEKYYNVVTRLVGDTIQMFSTMNVNGILVDQSYLWELSSVNSPINIEVVKMETELLTSKEIKLAEIEIGKLNNVPTHTLFGSTVKRSTFSLRKRDHLRTLFFKVMRLKKINEGADGLPSMDKDFQDEYRDNPIVSAYTGLNKAKKMRDAFVKSLIKIVSKNEDAKLTGRIRSQYKYLQVVTGRTSSTEPNLQQIPSHGKLAGYIKRAFIAGPGTIFIKVDYCVTGDTLLATEKGLVRIDSLATKNGKINLPMASIEGKNTAINWVYQGKKDTVVVNSEYGHKIVATPDHKIYILRDNNYIYEEAQNLKPTDYLCLPKEKSTATSNLELTKFLTDFKPKNSNNSTGNNGVYMEGSRYFIKIKQNNKVWQENGFNSLESAVEFRTNLCRKLNISVGSQSFKGLTKPKVMTPELAFFLGALIGDGYYTKHNRYNNVVVDNTDVKFLERISKAIQQVFGHPAPVKLQKKAGNTYCIKGVNTVLTKNLYAIKIRSNLLSTWLEELGVYSQHGRINGKTSCHHAVVPWSILQATEDCQLAFCASLFECDGHWDGNKLVLTTSVSTKLISQLQTLLQSHGLISKQRLVRKYKNKDNTQITLKDLLLPIETAKEFYSKFKQYLVSKHHNFKETANKRNQRLGCINGQFNKHYHFVKVSEVLSGKKRKVYDITMQDQSRHAFSANGVLVSNCAHEVRGLALVGNDKVLASSFQRGLDLYDAYLKNPTPENLRIFSEEGDIHIINACFFFGLKASEVSKMIRQSVKAVVFGLIYGRSAPSIAGALGKPVEEVEVIMKKFFNRFKSGSAWLDNVVKFGRKNAYVEAPSGLRRHLWPYLLPLTKLTERNYEQVSAACDRRAKNSPIQGLGSGIGYSAARHLEEATFKRFKKWSMKHKKLPIRNQNMVHDSMEHEVEYSHVGYALEMIQHSLTTGVQEKCTEKFGMKFPVGLSIDMDIGGSLDTVEKWDGSIESLHALLKTTLEFQRDTMKYDVDVEAVLTKIFTGYLPEFLVEQARRGYFTKAKQYGLEVDRKEAKINQAELQRQHKKIETDKQEKDAAAADKTTDKK